MAELRTFDEWSSSGFLIRKGSKAVSIQGGKAMFSRDQVTPKSARSTRSRESSSYQTYSPSYQRRYSSLDEDTDRQDDMDQADAYGITPWGGD